MQNEKFNILPGGLIKEGGNSVKNKTGSWNRRHAQVDNDKCIKCHQCVLHCPEGCIEILEDGRTVKVDPDFCKGCMVCAVECPVQAITMKEK
jgi:2-oxoacid:acceptor oxidoreductase delta subunit (pyruvate/2-ketoisovalerate family)